MIVGLLNRVAVTPPQRPMVFRLAINSRSTSTAACTDEQSKGMTDPNACCILGGVYCFHEVFWWVLPAQLGGCMSDMPGRMRWGGS